MTTFDFLKPKRRPVQFGRPGGPVRELKIHPKRLREEIKNDIEKRRNTNDKKTSRATQMLRDLAEPKILEALGPLGSPHEIPREPQEVLK